MAKVTVYIGRFQPFHNGHVHVLQQALETSDAVIVLVGSAHQSRTIKNPFTFDERKRMIQDWFDAQDHEVFLNIDALRDQPYNDAKWIQTVQEIVDEWSDPSDEITIIGSDRDSSTWYLSAFPQWKSKLIEPIMVGGVTSGTGLSATKLRERLFHQQSSLRRLGANDHVTWNDVPKTTYEIIHDFVDTQAFSDLQDEYEYINDYRHAWSRTPFPVSFTTVDAVVIQSGHVLVIERGQLPGKGLWALPGGFVNLNERLQDAVIRELVEETGIKIQPQVLKGSIKAKDLFDHPDRSLRGRTITTAFLIRLDDTKPLPRVKGQNVPLHESNGKAEVETTKAFWLPLHDARSKSELWFEDHHSIIDWAIGQIKD